MASLWTSAAQAQQQGFVESYYLGAKAAQLTTQTGTTWTVDMVKAAFASAGLEAYQHYQQYGFREGLNPNAYFNNSYYNTSKSTASSITTEQFQSAWNNVNGGSETSTYFHYLQYGYNEAGVNPASTFNEAQYYVDKAALMTSQTGTPWTVDMVKTTFAQYGLTPLTHYILYGGTPAEPTPQPVSGSTYPLTTGQDKATANVFDSVPAWSPGGNELVNTLQDFDQLTGTGTNPTLNVQLGDANDSSGTTITPQLNGIQTINAAFIGSGAAPVVNLDMQDATGINAVNITRVSGGNNAQVTNLVSVPATLSVANSNSPAGIVGFQMTDTALAGATEATTLTASNINVGFLRAQGANASASAVANQGIETVNLVSSGAANTVGILDVGGVQVLNISGDQNLAIGAIDYNYLGFGGGLVDGKFTTINGETATGALTLTVDNALNTAIIATTGTGTAVDFALKTGSGNDTLNVTATNAPIGDTTADTIDLGTGTDTVAFKAAVTNIFTNATSAAFKNVENVTVTRGTNLAADAAVLTVDMSRFSGGNELTTLTNAGDAGDVTTFTLNQLSTAQAAGLTINHSSTGSNGLANNIIVANLASGSGTSDTVGVTLANGINADPRFNFALTAGGVTAATKVENVTLTDNDTESNSVALNNFAQHTGTITLSGGRAGQFMNLDATANGYVYNTTGVTGSQTDTVKAAFTANPSLVTQVSATDSAVASAFVSQAAAGELLVATNITATAALSDVVLRVGTANQAINLGTGNDTVIFADRGGITNGTAGLTVADSVAAGTGSDTIILDGAGAQTLGNSEWTNLTGIDTIRLAGQAGSVYNLTINNQLVTQTDSGTKLNIVNNDGDLRNVAENAATIDIRALDDKHFVNFVGANGDGNNVGITSQANRAAQTIIANDVTVSGSNLFNGGDKDVVLAYDTTNFATQAAADTQWALNIANGIDGNNNVFKIFDAAVVTTSDLANVLNFSTIEFDNDLAVTQNLNLTLNDATADALSDASHTASATQQESLIVRAVDNINVVAATSTMNLAAGTLTNAFNVNAMLGRGTDTVTTGAGNDFFVMYGNYNTGTYGVEATVNYNMDLVANNTAGAHVTYDNIDAGTGFNTLVTYGAINLANLVDGGTIDAIVAHSAVVMKLSQWNALLAANPTGTLLTFEGDGTHQLTIINDVAGGGTVDLSKISLKGGNLVFDLTSSTQGGSGAITGQNAVAIPVTNPTGVAVTGIVGTNPSNSGAAVIPFAAHDTKIGTVGVDNTFYGEMAGLDGTTLTGNAADTETLQLTTAGEVNLNNLGTGGILTNIDRLILAGAAGAVNKIAFTGTSGIKDVFGAASDDTINMTNMTAGGSIQLGDGDDNIVFGTGEAATYLVTGATLNGGNGANTLEFTLGNDAENVNLATPGLTVTSFQNLSFKDSHDSAHAVTLGTGYTTLAVDTDNVAEIFNVSGTAAQLAGLTTITDTTGTGELNLLATTAGAINMSAADFTNVDNFTFHADGNQLTVKGAELSAGNLVKITGGAGQDTVIATLNGANLDLSAGTYSMIGVENLTFTGATLDTNMAFKAGAATNLGLKSVDISGISVRGATIDLDDLATTTQTVNAVNGVADSITSSHTVAEVVTTTVKIDNDDTFANEAAGGSHTVVESYGRANGTTVLSVDTTTSDLAAGDVLGFYNGNSSHVNVTNIGAWTAGSVNAEVTFAGGNTTIAIDADASGNLSNGDITITIVGQDLSGAALGLLNGNLVVA